MSEIGKWKEQLSSPELMTSIGVTELALLLYLPHCPSCIIPSDKKSVKITGLHFTRIDVIGLTSNKFLSAYISETFYSAKFESCYNCR